jgi:hypothetical protein
LIVNVFFSVAEKELHNFSSVESEPERQIDAAPVPTAPAMALIFTLEICQLSFVLRGKLTL